MTATATETPIRRRRGGVVVVLVSAAVIMLVAAAFAAGQSSVRIGADEPEVLGVQVEAARGSGRGGVTGAPPKTFGVSGDVADLFPGVPADLIVTITNDNAQAIDVESVVVTVEATGVAGCGANYLDISDFEGTRRVSGRSSATITLTSELSVDAPDACQGVSFPLSYGGSGVQVQGPGR